MLESPLSLVLAVGTGGAAAAFVIKVLPCEVGTVPGLPPAIPVGTEGTYESVESTGTTATGAPEDACGFGFTVVVGDEGEV